MKIAPICLLTACKRRKFKLFGVASQVRAIDNGITCCYWSASLSNRLRVLKAHSSLFKCCEKNWPNCMYWIQWEHRGSWVWAYFFDYLCHWNWFLLSLLIFNLILYIVLIRGEGATGREQPQGRKVTLASPKSYIGGAEKSHKGQNVTLECYNTCPCPWYLLSGHNPWWRHQMETFSPLLAICAGNSPVTGEFPAQRPVTRRFDVFFELRLNGRLSKQWRGWWFETQLRSLWRHCNALLSINEKYWLVSFQNR